MNTTPTDEVVLKQDVLGRMKTPKARREHLLDEFERSGLSGQKFAELAGIKYQTLATWIQKRRRQHGLPAAARVLTPSDKVRWLEAVVEQAQGSAGKADGSFLVLHLPGGVRVEIGEAQQVELAAALVRALHLPC
jgi:transposase